MRRRTLLHGEWLIDITSAVVTAASQTYDGTAKTPVVTVTLHGSVIDAANYDVTYSNNTNAGTAYITVTGKGDYTGTAAGTFNIAKAAPSYTAPTAMNPTYNGSSQYLTTTGTTAHGTIQYSADGSSWSVLPIERTNAGSYTTYWRLVGDANHTSIDATSITTYINKASRTLSFPSSYAVLDHGGTVTRSVTISAGLGDGTVTFSVGSTTYASVNYATGKVTAKSTDGSTTITATISEGTNYLSASASYTLYVFSTTAHDYSYNGSYHSVTLPPGKYKLQAWGAQGGSNAAESSYGITAQAGGKGGYSEGVFTLTSATNVRVYVGGAGGSSAGGFNGGGSSTGSASYSSGNTYGASRMGGGGGATDIRLSDGALLSRMIVAGGGSGGAMTYCKETTSTTTWQTVGTYSGLVRWNDEMEGGSTVSFLPTKASQLTDSVTWDNPFTLKPIFDYFYIDGYSKLYIDYFIYKPPSGINSMELVFLSVPGDSDTVPTIIKTETITLESSWIDNSYGNGVYKVPYKQVVNAIPAVRKIWYKNGISGVGFFDGSRTYNNQNAQSLTTGEIYFGISGRSVRSTGNIFSDIQINSCLSAMEIGEVYRIIDIGSISTITPDKGSSWGSIINVSNNAFTPNSELVGGEARTFAKTSAQYDYNTTVSYRLQKQVQTETSTETTQHQEGYVGGGTTGAGYSSTYQGKLNAAGSGGSFGQGANQTTTNYRYCSGAGGGGWYGGGGGRRSDSNMDYCKQSGGGSGFVNTAANENYRPSGYTGLELDSGETKDGNTSFPNTAGSGNETGHSGNGYARITRIA